MNRCWCRVSHFFISSLHQLPYSLCNLVDSDFHRLSALVRSLPAVPYTPTMEFSKISTYVLTDPHDDYPSWTGKVQAIVLSNQSLKDAFDFDEHGAVTCNDGAERATKLKFYNYLLISTNGRPQRIVMRSPSDGIAAWKAQISSRSLQYNVIPRKLSRTSTLQMTRTTCSSFAPSSSRLNARIPTRWNHSSTGSKTSSSSRRSPTARRPTTPLPTWPGHRPRAHTRPLRPLSRRAGSRSRHGCRW